MLRLCVLSAGIGAVLVAAGTLSAAEPALARPAPPPSAKAPSPVDFSRDIHPILKRSCFECHGPQKQEGELRLDRRADALAGGQSGVVVVAGKPEASELLSRVKLPKDDVSVMPARGDTLTRREIALLERWITAGAEWPETVVEAKHWAYVPPVRAAVPQPSDMGWVRNPIDAFILDRLDREGLRPSPEAPPETLVRRLYLDLTGLPPSPAEVDEFLAAYGPSVAPSRNDGGTEGRRDGGTKEAAYAALVEKLLASPQFGERWARPWLDLARYADSHGFQRDDLREIWPYRDWVIRALNADMPFDRFTLEQIAGDLLPDANEQTRIATGFHRATTTNVEAGSEPEETRVNQVFDRVNTTGAVWLGTTFECAQCHDHKYDPISQRDYYRLFAYFNNTELEADRSNPKVPGSIRFLGPSMELGDPETIARRNAVNEELKQLEKQIAARREVLAGELSAWEASLAPAAGTATAKPKTALKDAKPAQVAQIEVLRPEKIEAEEGSEGTLLDDGSIGYFGEDPPETDTYVYTVRTNLRGITAFKLEALTDKRLPGEGPGRGDPMRPNFVLHDFSVTAAPAAGGKARPVRFTKAQADFSQRSFDPAGAVDGNPKTAWAINPQFHQPHWARFECGEPVGFEGGTVLTIRLAQNFGGSRLLGRVRISALTGDLTVAETAVDAPAKSSIPEEVAAILKTPAKKRNKKQTEKLVDYRAGLDAEIAKLRKQETTLKAGLRGLKVPSTLVMRELEDERPAAVFMRGNYTSPGENVSPGVPSVLPQLPKDSPENRIALARWLVDRGNPLTARVTVNRWWAELFGHGIVSTVEDFGIKGEAPTHPELLDWLAVEFMEGTTSPASGKPEPWSFKHVLRLIVTSNMYRRSSSRTPELVARDDRNLLYARGPRLRMDAEMIRDNALAIAGLLSKKQFGPPIKPPQPDGLWTKVGGEKYEYVVSPGEDKYRRGLYVVWKRGSPYPSFINFDASQRTACTVKRSRSNTPLQALTLLNDPVYVEAAVGLAKRIAVDVPTTDVEARLAHAFQLATARRPGEAEKAALLALYQSQEQAARNELRTAEFAKKFDAPAGLSPAEFSAWYTVAAAILNLDETITKE
jgi:mono/diheme cytochrome c family protein